MYPQAIAGREVGNLANGQRFAGSRDFGLDTRAIQVECRTIVGINQASRTEKQKTPK
jgi:hypothetical protein